MTDEDRRSLKILVVGNGGREHALLWKLRRDAPEVDQNALAHV